MPRWTGANVVVQLAPSPVVAKVASLITLDGQVITFWTRVEHADDAGSPGAGGRTAGSLVSASYGSQVDPTENALLRAPANHVSPRARWFWATRAAIGWVIVLGVEAGATFAAGVAPLVITLASTAAVAVIHLAVMPQWRYRVHTWEDAGGAVYTQTGWITQERRIAPVNRIQTVDTQRGPIEQLFKLSNVTVTTASAAGPLKIHGLDRATADQLVATLTQRTQQSPDDAT
jgi:uncharacterized protein